MTLDFSKFLNQDITLTEEEVQALADSASSKPMLPGIHEVVVSAIPSDRIAFVDEPNGHLMKFIVKVENVSGETASIYCELPIDKSKLYKIDKDGNQNRKALGRHTKTLNALGVLSCHMDDFVNRIIATGGEAFQGLKGFKAKVIVKRDDKKCRLEYDQETGAYFLTRNDDNTRLVDEPFALSGTGKERFAEAELRARELHCTLEQMPQVDVQALVEVENNIQAVLSYGKVVNKVQGAAVAVAAVKLGVAKTTTVAATVTKSTTVAAVVAKPVTKPAPKPAVVVPVEELPTEEELHEQAADYDTTEA